MRNLLKKLAYSILACILVLTTVVPVTAKAETEAETVTDKKNLDVQVENVTYKYMVDEDFEILREKMEECSNVITEEYTNIIYDDKIRVNFYNENSDIYINYDNSVVSPECVVSDRMMVEDTYINGATHSKINFEADQVGVCRITAFGIKAKRDETDKLVIESAEVLGYHYLDFSITNDKVLFNADTMYNDITPWNCNNILPTTFVINENISESYKEHIYSVNYCGGSDARSKVKDFLEKKGSVSDYDLLIYRYYYALDYQGNENNQWSFTDVFFLPEGQQTVFNLRPADETPATGDSTNYALYIMFAVSSLGAVVLVRRKRMSERA